MRCLIVLALFFGFSSLHAVELVNEQFTTSASLSTWSRSDNSKVYWDSANNNSLFIDRNDWAAKTYSLGADYANQPLTVAVNWCATSPWESSQDYLRVRINDSADFPHYDGGGCQQLNFTTSADGSGNFKIQFSPITTSNDEDAYIDWFTVNGTPLAQMPPTIGNIPDQTPMVDTPFTLNVASFTTLTNGDAILPNGYVLTGSLPSWLSFDANTGILSGTPTETASAISFSVTAEDNDGVSNSESFSITVIPLLSESTGGRDFVQRTQYNLFGDVRVIGNTVLCIKNASNECVEPSNSNSNADTNLQKAPLSYSTLAIPENATVEYARIYWQGRKAATSSNLAWDSTSKADAGKIKLRKGNTGVYTELTADIKDFDTTDSRNYVRIYSASADAKDIVTGSDTYYVDTSSFYTHVGDTNDDSPSDGLGAYGAWVLVVVYNDPDESNARNVTIFDGYKTVKSGNTVNISVSGFLTPKSGTVDSKTYTFTGEGDRYLPTTGDVIKMAGLTYNTSYQDLGTFNSRIDVDGNRSPELTNNNGIDIHKYDTGTTSGARNIITTNETGAKFQFTSNGDTYFPSLIVFSTQLYLPQLCYDYSVRQDGHYLPVDREAYPIAQLDSRISSSPLDVVVYLRNNEADLAAQGLAIKADSNDTLFYHTGNMFTSNTNGSALIDRGTPTSSTPLCDYDRDGDNSVSNNGCTNGHDIRKGLGTLDAYEYVYLKYRLQPRDIMSIDDINTSLGLSLKYYIVANGSKIEYPDYLLGSQNVPLCPPTTSYQPQWGQFNVVQRGLQTNNLTTQISRKPFDVDVIFDSSPTTGTNDAPASAINTTVLVEMIDIDSLGDINASCANPDSALSASIVVPFQANSSNYQSQVPTQPTNYYNFAVKNGAFRVWFFVDENGALIQDWTASTNTNGTVITAISGLYNAAAHPVCASSCADDTSTDCYNCIKMNYALPLCSRDNFSVRPESFDVRVYDVDKALPAYNINTDPTNPKNTTKIDLSAAYNYAADALAIPAQRIDLATGYDYRFDIAATGNDSLASVPGYTRIFDGEPEYNARLYWDPQSTLTGCNDTDDKDIFFYVANGLMRNEERNHDQVGEYRFNISDTSWTNVDSVYLSHHNASHGFVLGNDCISGSSASNTTPHGCIITTNHPAGGGGFSYKDHDLTFHPYQFNIGGVAVSVGEDNNAITPTSFVYMNDISVDADENMSVHVRGPIVAEGADGLALSNFVTNCYAKSLDLNISRSVVTLPVAYQYRLKTHDSDNSLLNDSGAVDLNNSTAPIQIAPNSFSQALGGTVRTFLNLNFERDRNVTVNPEQVSLGNYDINCTNAAANCQFNADLMLKTPSARKDLNATVRHYYGRSFATKQRFPGQSGTALINYEVYCDTGCTMPLLQGTTTSLGGDANWFINPSHLNPDATAGFGGTGTGVAQKTGAIRVTAFNITTGTNSTTGHHQDSIDLTYDGSRGFPYATTMRHWVEPWLIYNKYDAAEVANEFDVEFMQGIDGSWAGKHETNSETNTTASQITNRRTLW